MHMAKTDQAAQTHSSSNRNTSAQPYRGTHIYVHFLKIPFDCLRSLNSANVNRHKSMTCADRLLDNHMVISESRKS